LSGITEKKKKQLLLILLHRCYNNISSSSRDVALDLVFLHCERFTNLFYEALHDKCHIRAKYCGSYCL